jgi:hypothetical protein
MTGYATAMERAKVMRQFLLKHGVPEVSIELQVGRPSGADDWNAFQPVAVMSHHIASNPTVANPTPGLYVVKHGRSDLPGPLCNGTAGVDLVYRIITLGMANHPGEGGPITVDGACGAYTLPKDYARAYAWGTEYEGGYSETTWNATYKNKRTGKSMSFREFMGRANAGLCEGIWFINGHHQRPAPQYPLMNYHMEHKTWAPTRKTDRLGYTTESGREEIKKWAPYTIGSAQPLGLHGTERFISLPVLKMAANAGIHHPTTSVALVQGLLKEKYNHDLHVNGLWDSKTNDAYTAHQRTLGMKSLYCDGSPGTEDLKQLVGTKYKIK